MYTEYYGLTDRPFQPAPDPAFYFDSQTHRKAMAYLGYGLAQGEGFIVITGDAGTGKTMLVGHLAATIDRSRLTAVCLISSPMEGDAMLRRAAQGLGLATEGEEKPQLLGHIERYLHAEAAEGRHVLLLVDEAQNLTVSALEELRTLSDFQVEGQALVQIFLLGRPELRDTLETDGLEQLRRRVIATHHLEPMRAEEIGPYVAHRLSQAGWRDHPSFTPDAFTVLYRHSGGVPHKLNVLANRLLLLGALGERTTLDGEAVESAVRHMAEDGSDAASKAPPAAPSPIIDHEAPVGGTAERIAALEARIEEQEVALRRVLTLLIDWVESDSAYAPRSNAGHGAA